MAELTIRLRRDPATGKHDILIDLKSDSDALPHEHEQMHREAVEKIIGKENVGRVIIEREEERAPLSPQGEPSQQERRAQAQSEYSALLARYRDVLTAGCGLRTADGRK